MTTKTKRKFDTLEEWLEYIIRPIALSNISRYCTKNNLSYSSGGKEIALEYLRGIRVDAFICWLFHTWDIHYCTICKCYKDVSEFSLYKAARYGREKRCKSCSSKYLTAYYQRPEVNQKFIDLRNSDKRKEYMSEYFQKNKEEAMLNTKLNKRQYVEDLADCYIVNRLTAMLGVPASEITRDDIEIHRARIKIVRLMRKKSSSN